MPLTDTAIRHAKPKAKAYKLADEKGLFLYVTPSGGKWWRLKYRFGGKEKLISLGVHPDVSLKTARERRDDARRQLADGIDPSENRKARKAASVAHIINSFEVVAREWFSRQAKNWAESHSGKIIGRLERDVFPWLGATAIDQIKAPALLDVLRRIEARGAIETAHRVQQNCGQVFRYAIATGRAEADPTAALRGALTPWRPNHYPALTDPAKLGQLLDAIDGYRGGLVARSALRLLPLVFVRPGELRHAEWTEFDLANSIWIIPAAKMKIKSQGDHLVPLSKQAMEILLDTQALTGRGRYVFPSNRGASRPLSENTINAALRYLGYSKEVMTGHGFRAIARTILDETLGFRPDIIEHQLAHAVKDPNGRAYNRTAHLSERQRMMQTWADYLNGLRNAAQGSAAA